MTTFRQTFLLMLFSLLAIEGYSQCPTTVSIFPYSESFESSSSAWLPIIGSTGCSETWARNSGGTSTSGTGPGSASNGSYYIYTEASFGCTNKTMVVKSPCFDFTDKLTASVSFDYHMYGSSMGLLILEYSTNNGSSWSSLWSKFGYQSTGWNAASFNLPSGLLNQVVQFRFKGITGANESSDMAVDNVVINAEGSCGPLVSTFPYIESFESATTLWEPISTASGCIEVWSKESGGTPTPGTGPNAASDGTFYIYTESSASCNEKKFIVEGPCFDLSGYTSAAFSFDYSMYGRYMGDLFLEISLDDGETWEELWSESHDQEDPEWLSEKIILTGNYVDKIVKLRFHGLTGWNWLSDMAVDNLKMDAFEGIGTCTPIVDVFPHCESFESLSASWTPITSSTSCTGVWARDAMGTSSSGTGPRGAIDGDFYLYTEASAGCNNTVMRVISPCYDLRGITETDFSFDYHMDGEHMGTLFLEISLNDGATWTPLWAKTGHQGKLWYSERITLDGANANKIIKLRFTGVTGPSFRSDMAIDNLKMRGPTGCTASGLSAIGSAVFGAITPGNIVEESTCQEADIFTCNNRLDAVLMDGPSIFAGVRDMLATAQHEVLISFFAWDAACQATFNIGQGLKQSEVNHSASDPLLVKIIIDANIIATAGEWENVIMDISTVWNLDMTLFKFEVYKVNNIFGTMHDKYIIVDRQQLFVTGANPQKKHDANFMDFQFCENLPGHTFIGAWRDFGFIFTGEVAKSAFSTFNHTLITEGLNGNTQLVGLLGNLTGQSSAPEFICSPVGNLPILAATKRRDGSISTNDVDNGQDQAWITLMDEAKTNIDIATPNINDDKFKERLIAAVGRGVKVNLVIGRMFNSGATANNAPFQGGFNMEVIDDLRNEIRDNHPAFVNRLEVRWHSIDGAVQILDNGGRALHGKYMSVDDKIVMIGSGNNDTQSWNYSQEFNLVIDDEPTAQLIKAQTFTPTWNTGNTAYVELYDEKDGKGKLVSVQSTLHNIQLNYELIEDCDADKYVENNDDAKSAIIYNTPSCKKITLFDDGFGSTNDDFVEITTKVFIDRLVINEFEKDRNDWQVLVDYCCNGNLNGKVSAIKIEDECVNGSPQHEIERSITGGDTGTMKIYPNPVGEEASINLEFELAKEQNVELRVMNALGALVHREEFILAAGKNSQRLSGDILPASGIYTFIAISNGNVLATSKMTKI